MGGEEHSLPVHEVYGPLPSSRVLHVASEAEYEKMYKQSISDPEKFWGELANSQLAWSQPFRSVRGATDLSMGDVQWFLGGKLNACYNAVDRWAAIHPEKIAIIAEGDSFTNLSPDEFYNKIVESQSLCKRINGKIVSFAGPCYMTGGEWWNMTKDHGELLEVPHFLMGTTYLVMKSERESILNKIKTTGWHSPDFWLAWNYNMKSKILVSKDPICFQKEGYSALDYLEKDTWF